MTAEKRSIIRTAAAAAAVLLLSSCSIGDIRRPAPRPAASTPTPAAAPAPSNQLPRADEIRDSYVPVPRDFAQQSVTFETADIGYALFVRCGRASTAAGEASPSCTAILISTVDGGRNWVGVPHPEPIAANHQVFVGHGTVVLLAEPHGWYVSTDGARTWGRRPMTKDSMDAYHAVDGRFQVCCFRDGVQGGQLAEWTGERIRVTKVQPPVGGLQAVASTGERLFAAGVRDGRLSVAISENDGHTWHATAVGGDSGGLTNVEILVSRGADDVWLLGYEERFGFPSIWRYDSIGWRPVAAQGAPDGFHGGAAAIGDGMLAITGPSGPALVKGGAYQRVRWPVGSVPLHLIGDGSLFGDDGSNTWLGTGNGEQRRWIKILLYRV